MKAFLQRMLRYLGFEVRRYRPGETVGRKPDRPSLEGALQHLRGIGFRPATVIDVGAAMGGFTRSCHTIFPDASYLLIEPLEEYLPALRALERATPKLQYRIAAASSSEVPSLLNVHDDLVGSSLYRETEEGTGVNGTPRLVTSVTIDQLVAQTGGQPPYLIKVDVQGAELDVLAGGASALAGAEVVLLEVSFFNFFLGAPLIGEVIGYMQTQGFVPYDMVGLQYRPIDGALSQADMLFVKEQGLFRQVHGYATPAQRIAQTQNYRSYLMDILASERVP